MNVEELLKKREALKKQKMEIDAMIKNVTKDIVKERLNTIHNKKSNLLDTNELISELNIAFSNKTLKKLFRLHILTLEDFLKYLEIPARERERKVSLKMGNETFFEIVEKLEKYIIDKEIDNNAENFHT